jgi:signal-induced proliferation-associated 1 like protein 3
MWRIYVPTRMPRPPELELPDPLLSVLAELVVPLVVDPLPVPLVVPLVPLVVPLVPLVVPLFVPVVGVAAAPAVVAGDASGADSASGLLVTAVPGVLTTPVPVLPEALSVVAVFSRATPLASVELLPWLPCEKEP